MSASGHAWKKQLVFVKTKRNGIKFTAENFTDMECCQVTVKCIYLILIWYLHIYLNLSVIIKLLYVNNIYDRPDPNPSPSNGCQNK
jgi:hypothetical protein